MGDLRQDVLQAEVAIKLLAEEMAKARGISDNVEQVKQRLQAAAEVLERNRMMMEEILRELKHTIDLVKSSNEQFTEVVRNLSTNIIQSTEKLVEAGQQAINSVIKTVGNTVDSLSSNVVDISTKIDRTILEISRKLDEEIWHVRKALEDLSHNFQNHMKVLASSDEQIKTSLSEQDAKARHTSKLVVASLIFSVTAASSVITLLILQFLR